MTDHWKIGAVCAGLAVFVTASGPAMATPAIGLELLIDDSGSITPSNYNIQRTGYVNALNSVLPADGSVAVGVIEFDGIVRPVFTLQTITAVTKAALLAAIGSMIDHGGATATGPAIQSAAAALGAFGGLSKKLIDVSTDGFGNVGLDEGTAATQAVAGGVAQVNVLCIGNAANCSFNKGTNSFSIPATFATIESSLTTKLQREIGVPEPSSLTVLGIALVGLVRRLRRT